MSQVIGPRPLQEVDLCDHLWTQPNTFLHLLRRKPLTPAAGGQLWKVSERAFGRLQVFNPFEDLTSRCRDEAGPHPGCVNEVLPTVEANHERIDAQMAWNTRTFRWRGFVPRQNTTTGPPPQTSPFVWQPIRSGCPMMQWQTSSTANTSPAIQTPQGKLPTFSALWRRRDYGRTDSRSKEWVSGHSF